jgi:hypothetical protein
MILFNLQEKPGSLKAPEKQEELAGVCTVLKMAQKSMQIATVQLIFSEK